MKPRCVPKINPPQKRVSFETTLGTMTATASSKGLIAITLHRQRAPKIPEPVPAKFNRLIESFRAYCDGKIVGFDDIELDLSSATPFQKSVWEAARSIPYGETRSYRWVAEKIGKPGAARAVGQALGKNPLPVIIPCHRVIASGGGMGGYSGGLKMKRQLLDLESLTSHKE